jgi:hypothetical protein
LLPASSSAGCWPPRPFPYPTRRPRKDELVLAHPGDTGTPASVSLILGGTALFLVGHGHFVWAVYGDVPWSRFAGVVALAALAPLGPAMPVLALLFTAGAAWLVARGVASEAAAIHGLVVGLVVGLIVAAVDLGFGGAFGVGALAGFVVTVGAG